MPCCTAPGGVLAGVVGTERALLKPVSIESGWAPVAFWTLAPFHSYELPWPPMPIMLDALVGGVGKV